MMASNFYSSFITFYILFLKRDGALLQNLLATLCGAHDVTHFYGQPLNDSQSRTSAVGSRPQS